MALEKLTTHNATCQCLKGEVIGLKTVSEQHISGHSSIRGEQSLTGHYRGAHAGVPAHGEIQGFSYLIGESHLSTQYSYYTQFFVRDDKGVDHPILLEGRLPLMDGHAVTCVYVKNMHRETALCSVINRNTRIAHHTITRRDLIRHLDMPTRRSVRRMLLSPLEKRDEIRKLKNRWATLLPWLYVILLVGLTVFFIGLIVFKKRDSLGTFIMFTGACPALLAFGGVAYRYLAEWQLRYQPSHETVVVRNQELEDELDAIAKYIDDVTCVVCR